MPCAFRGFGFLITGPSGESLVCLRVDEIYDSRLDTHKYARNESFFLLDEGIDCYLRIGMSLARGRDVAWRDFILACTMSSAL
jgi:hypothetical protein